MLEDSQIDEFKEKGVIIVENILTEEEIVYYRNCLHEELKNLDMITMKF